MQTLRLGVLVLVVLAVHLAGWRMAADASARFAPERAGVRWIEAVSAGASEPAAARMTRQGSMATATATATATRMPEPPPGPRPVDGIAGARQADPRAAMRHTAAARVDADAREDAGARATPRDARPGARRTPGAAQTTPAAHEATRQAVRQGTPRPFGDGGTTPRAPPGTRPWPTYPTRTPPSTTLRYTLLQGPATTGGDVPATSPLGSADLEWTRDASAFALRLSTTLPGRAPREWRSAGTFDEAGVAPVRLVERERGRDRRAVNFDREGRRVRFSGVSQVLPLSPGTQDRWSWIAQVAAIAEAASAGGTRPIPAGTRWEIPVAGLRGDLDRWVFRVLPDTGPPAGIPPSVTPRACALLYLRREPERPYDLRIEAWLSPALHHLPEGLRMSTPPGSWSFALWRDSPDDAGTTSPPRTGTTVDTAAPADGRPPLDESPRRGS